MTIPTDAIARLSERLREIADLYVYTSPKPAAAAGEAATAIDALKSERDALQARVKELEQERNVQILRALRAEQERDEAIAVLKPFMPDPAMMDILWGDMDDEATGSHTIKLKHFRTARDLVRRLAGPEKEGE